MSVRLWIDGFPVTLSGFQVRVLERLRGGGAPPVLIGVQRRAAAYCARLGLTQFAPRDVAVGRKPHRYVLTERGRALLDTMTKIMPNGAPSGRERS